MAKEIRNRRGIIFIISAPSGTGKTTLCHKLLNVCDGLKISISYTTRKPRGKEINGVDYFFVTQEEFLKMIEANEFLEWATVHGNLYGTVKKVIDDYIMEGRDVLLDIDVQGGKIIKNKIPDAVAIFLLPPSLEILERRLKNRMTENDAVISQRLAKAKDEIKEYRHYDYVVVNDVLEESLLQLKSIIQAERFKVSRVNHEWIDENFIR
ncbi:MAG: guanylate kinase [Thermodesulfovibrionales bacterium]|nr:guanylate kinase [Thermodesulfovibrionales bacterium]